jgi:hypothetical protein
VQVALDGADDRRRHRLHARGDQMRLEQLGALLHRTGGQQHLRHENLVVLELFADDPHALAQRLIQHPRRRNSFLQGTTDQLDHLGGATFDQRLPNLINRHSSSCSLLALFSKGPYFLSRIHVAIFTL